MTGIGTLINAVAIVIGGLIGITFKRFLKENFQENITKAVGLAVIFMGIAGTLSKMIYIEDNTLNTQGTLLLIISLALGTLIGEAINIEYQFERFGEWLKRKTGNQKDNQFVNAFITSSFTVCIGAMAIIGAIQEGMLNDPSTLIAKALLDFLIILIMSATLGKGCLFSAIPVAIFQLSITYLAKLISPLMTTVVLDNISLVGSVLIFCVGVNLIEPKKFSVANMLPAILIAIIYGLII